MYPFQLVAGLDSPDYLMEIETITVVDRVS